MSFNSTVLKSSSSLRPSQQGFTLIELLITIVIMAILLAIATPNIAKTTAKQQVKDATSTFVTALRDAKAESVIINDDISVEYDSASQTLKLLKSDGTEIGNRNVSDTNTITISTEDIVFTKNKTATQSTIEICNAKQTIKEGTKIIVSPTAIISVTGVTC